MGNIFSKKDHVQLIEEPEEDNKKLKISLQNLKIEDDKQIIQDKEKEQFNSENKQDDQANKKLKDPYLLQYETIFYNFEKIGQDFKHQNIDDIIVYQNKSEIDYNLTYKEIIRPQYPIEEIYQSMEDWHPNIIQIQDPSKRPDFMELDKQLDQILKTSRVKNFLNNKYSRLIMSREQAEQNIKEIVKIQTEKIYYQYEKEIIKLKSTKQKKMSKKELQELQEQQEIMQLELEGKEVLNDYDYKLMGQQLIFSEMQKLQKTQMLQMKIQQEQIQNQELMNEQYQIHISSNCQLNEKEEIDKNNEKDVIKFDFLDMKLENEVIKSEDGEIYKGQTYKGVRNGNGKQTYKDGTYYIGEFIDDKKSGKGKLFNKQDQIIYEGLFYDDKYNGQGLLQNQNVQFLKNSEQFNYNFFSKLQNKWEKYEGEFKQGIQEGFGILFISNNSEKFVGNFTKGIPNGYGTYYQNNGNKVNGYWENGKLTKVL
ncbi:hypothetical protein PPERSA_09625 [Pseudocohnilembus persalinus]|uniref:MORN repeat-containing protein 3 n=1 Tax=Pseudocohnilembus persalinus TaxID=266149 RepID=A0A0V0QFP8_PSEPJ|nr:hypothetical protein PPERSA_09625 [Pseudocohnilembus persalinus]|eukprot:KRX01019.1 hypothetical protein PPERSA_09625 [Pseudocohnilembus persalinus]